MTRQQDTRCQIQSVQCAWTWVTGGEKTASHRSKRMFKQMCVLWPAVFANTRTVWYVSTVSRGFFVRVGDDCQVNETRRPEAGSSVTIDSGSLATISSRAPYSELGPIRCFEFCFFDRQKSLFIPASRWLHMVEFAWTSGSFLVNFPQISHLKPGISQQAY